MKAEKTKVIFRKWKNSIDGVGVVAFFPEIPASNLGYDCLSYEHMGQHGGADYNGLLSITSPATPAEYKDLLTELEGCGYCLQIVKRQTLRDVNNRKNMAKSV